MGRAATDIDIVIGARIRAVRLERGLSQSDVADRIGITFQQMQKYETGKNRIAAATLAQIAETLDVAIAELIPLTQEVRDSVSLELLQSAEARELLDAFVRIRAPALRRVVLSVCAAALREQKDK